MGINGVLEFFKWETFKRITLITRFYNIAKEKEKKKKKKNQPSAHHDRFDRCVGGADSA